MPIRRRLQGRLQKAGTPINFVRMSLAWNDRKVPGAVALALLVLLSTGCAKEEVVQPASVDTAPMMQRRSANGQGTVGPIPGQGGNVSPISDDGDDLGDRERSNRPK